MNRFGLQAKVSVLFRLGDVLRTGGTVTPNTSTCTHQCCEPPTPMLDATPYTAAVKPVVSNRLILFFNLTRTPLHNHVALVCLTRE